MITDDERRLINDILTRGFVYWDNGVYFFSLSQMGEDVVIVVHDHHKAIMCWTFKTSDTIREMIEHVSETFVTHLCEKRSLNLNALYIGTGVPAMMALRDQPPGAGNSREIFQEGTL